MLPHLRRPEPIILPTVMAYNAPATGEKYRDIARAMGVPDTDTMTEEQYRKAADRRPCFIFPRL